MKIRFNKAVKKYGYTRVEVMKAWNYFSAVIEETIRSADEVHLKGLFAVRLRSKTRKRVMTRGKSKVFIIGRHQKMNHRKRMNRLNKKKREKLTTPLKN